MAQNKNQDIINLLKREVKPALGCTEPIAVAFGTALMNKNMHNIPESIEIFLSENVLKNGMGVGIPGTNKSGLLIAAALGFVGGDADAELEVLKKITPDHLIAAENCISKDKIKIHTKDTSEKLYIEAIGKNTKETVKVVISGSHTNVVLIQRNDEIILKQKKITENNKNEDKNKGLDSKEGVQKLSVKEIYDFAMSAPFEDIKFILEGKKINTAIALEGLINDYGLKVGKSIQANIDRGIFSEDIATYATALTSAGADARMGGCPMPVMSNSGSGNQGLTISMPIIAIAEKLKIDEEKLTRALILGNLLSIHEKSYLGRLSALCGVVTASVAAAGAITYLLNGNFDNMIYAMKNVIGNIAGMICDGAKPGCALKVSSGTTAAIQAAYMAMDGIEISENDGIIEKDIEKTIINLTKIGSEGMLVTDKMIVDIMVCK